MRTILIVVALALVPSAAAAQEDSARWLPWIGCWQSSVEFGAVKISAQVVGEESLVCIVPAEGGVKMLTVAGDQISTDQTVIADGLTRAIAEPPCTGERRADWSSNGHLLFTRAEIACETGPRQRVSGLHLFTSGPTWVDIQVVEVAGRENVRAQRYERMKVPESVAGLLSPELIAQATVWAERLGREQPLTVNDIIEANSKVPPAAIEAALFETKTRFALSSRSLIALNEAGVEEPVIDLMLAISYPERFAVNRWVSPQPFAVDLFPEDSVWLDWSFSGPYRAHRPYSGFYSTYGSIWYNSGWDLRYFPRGDSYAPADSYGITGSPDTRGGSVVKGQGYTRGQPPVSTSTESSNASGSAASTRARGVVRAPSSSTASDSGSGGSSGSNSGGGSSASSGGYSSGSSGGDSGGGRTAVDRD